MHFLALLFGNQVWKMYSLIIKWVLRVRGIKVGSNFHIEGRIKLYIRNKPQNIKIGNNVYIMGDIELKIRENGRIEIGNNCKIDKHVRLVAANNAILSIGSNTNIGAYCIMNGGDNISIGENVLIAGFAYIQSSNHGTKKAQAIKTQPHTYAPIDIGDGAWIGGHCVILPGSHIGNGSVIGAHSLVKNIIPDDAIAVGNPATVKKYRT